MKNLWPAVSIFALFIFTGCAAQRQAVIAEQQSLVVMKAKYADTPIVVDGRLDEPVWGRTDVYTMNLADDRSAEAAEIEENGRVRLAWDDEYFYVGVEFDDSDIVAEGENDQLMHFKLGDVCELFLKPAEKTWYWELYVTPLGKKSSFWFPGRGRMGLPGNFKYECGLDVAAQCEGTLNNWADTDKCWTAEMAVPVRDLTAHGEDFSAGADWRILVARYNYGRYLKCYGAELTMTPKLSRTRYHLLEEYAILELVK